MARAAHYEQSREWDPFTFPFVFARRARHYKEAFGATDGDLARVVANLIDNAITATPSGGTVRVSARVVASRVEVRVVDTGIGLSADELTLVTQRFYRTPASRRHGEGSGLGLSIVDEICTRHGTRLRLHSAPGEGTQAAFDLPIA